ncbi:MAG: amidohydrolase family protein, partial [Anaerolineae bacterium]|nr:amidohydrolase family protein [Anaerolineae bacterium]
PRAYGAFARVLARYVRDEQIIPLEEAIRRMTALPADNLRIKERGRLQPGHYADVVVFDPATIQDHATPENPHQYATGVQHVFVNGVQVLRDGEHTGAKPGRVVRGPGYGKQPFEAVYPAELLPLFKLGLGYDGTYAEFGLRRDQIPDLIRIVKDSRLYVRDKEDDPVQYAPIHAAWMLSRLGAAEALEAVSQLIIHMHPIGPSEILSIMETFGPVAIAEMTKIIDSPLLYILSRLAAAAALTRIGLEHGPMWATVVENLFLERLQQHNTPILLLAGLAAFLERLETENEEVELAVKAARKHAVSMGLAKSWDETYKLLRGDDELKVEPGNLIDSDDGDDDDYLPPADTSAPTAGWKAQEAKAAKKKKAKRKMTDKIKKQQRKKKR